MRPEERFATTAEFRTALEEAEASTVGRAVQRNERRRRAPLAIGLGAVLVTAVWWGAVGRSDRERAIRLAVLPFANITSDSSQEYFSDGLTEEMITQLSILQPRRLKVIGRASIMRYKAVTTPIDQIGRELNVAYVLTGSVRREGDRVRIGAQLVRTREQEQVWSDDFDRELTDILALQGDVAKGVAKSLALVLLPAEVAVLDRGRTVNPRAYEAYLKGHEYARRLSSADLDLALQFFELAMREDSLYALAYIGIAQVWGSRSQMGFANPREAAPKVSAALSRALELDSLLPDVHYRLATRAIWTEWDWKKGEREFRRAIELNPRYAEAKALYGHLLSILGRRDEALTQMREALEIDPLSDELHALYAAVLNHAGRHREALAEAHIVLRTAPGNVIAQNNVMNAFEHLGMCDSSIAAERRARLARNDKAVVEALDRGMAEGGFVAAKQRVANVLAARAEAAGTAPLAVANHYADAGDTTRALEWVERSFERHDPNIPYLSVARNWDPLRGQPRFRALLDSLGLPSVPR